MAEYAGYVAAPPVNYGEITNGLVSNIIAIDQAKREEDKKTQADFDKYFNDNTKAIKDFDFSKSQTFNDMISSVANGIKDAKLNAYKTGSKQAVNRFSANATTSIKNINDASKAINEGFGVIEKATLEGKVSDIGNVYADFYTDAMNFTNGAFMVMDDGTIPYVKYDEKGKIASKNSFFDPATLTKPVAFIDPKVDYEKDLNDWVKNIGTYKNEQGTVTTASPKLNPAFPKAKETKIAELTSTPRNTARFLSSVAGYRGYKNDAAKKELLDSGIPEDKLIKVDLINGVPQPILTDSQQKAAKQIALQQIDQRVGVEKTVDEPVRDPNAWMQSYLFKEQRTEAKKMAPKIKAVQIADAIFGARQGKPGQEGKLGPIAAFSPLKEAARMKGWKKISVSNVGGDVIVYGVPKAGKSGAAPVEMARFSSPGEVYSFMTGKENIIDAKADYDLTKDYMLGNSPEPETQKTTTVKSTSGKKAVSLSLIRAMSSAQRGGLSPEQYAEALKQNYPETEIVP